MLKINKKYILITIIFIFILGISTLWFVSIRQKINLTRSANDIQKELEYGNFIRNEVAKKPFLAYLPINTPDYIILYDSVKKQIVVVFYDKSKTIEIQRQIFQDEISKKLNDIGAGPNVVQINWKMVK